jgi:hypothetical protein
MINMSILLQELSDLPQMLPQQEESQVQRRTLPQLATQRLLLSFNTLTKLETHTITIPLPPVCTMTVMFIPTKLVP